MSQFSWEHLIWFSGGAGWISDEYRKTKVWGRMNNLQSFNLCENWKTKVCTKNDCREDLKSAQRPIAGTWNDTLKHKFISPVFSASPKHFNGQITGDWNRNSTDRCEWSVHFSNIWTSKLWGIISQKVSLQIETFNILEMVLSMEIRMMHSNRNSTDWCKLLSVYTNFPSISTNKFPRKR